MTTSASIQLAVLQEDNGELHYEIRATNGTSATCLDFYGCKAEWQEFAMRLRAFPGGIKDEVRFEQGKDDPKWAYYMSLRVYCYDSAGHSAIEVCVVSPATPPYGHRDHFYIRCEPAGLNRLGQLLADWQPQQGSKLEWKA